MSQPTWTAVDQYLSDLLLPQDAALDDALAASVAAGLPAISVSPIQGKLLHLLARICRAERILEIGTLGGYSTIWLARALPRHGKLLTLEIDPHHAAVAPANFDRAGLTDRVQLCVASARETLAQLASERVAPFDFVFIDADKPSAPRVFRLIPPSHASRQPDHRRQCRPRRGSHRRCEQRRKRPGRAQTAPQYRQRTSRHRHDPPNRRPQGLRRFRPRLGELIATRASLRNFRGLAGFKPG